MISKSIRLQLVNLFFSITPLTRDYKLREKLLQIAGIDCSTSARIVSTARIISRDVSIGEDTFIEHQALISGGAIGKITIGNYVDIAPRVVILSGTHKINMQGNHSAGECIGLPIWIEDGVWIGANSTILPGVTIGRKSVIGAGSVVVDDIPACCIAVGNPCKPIKHWSPETASFEKIINK